MELPFRVATLDVLLFLLQQVLDDDVVRLVAMNLPSVCRAYEERITQFRQVYFILKKPDTVIIRLCHYSTTTSGLIYRVTHLLGNLGWVDIDLGSSLGSRQLQQRPTSRGNSPNLSQPNKVAHLTPQTVELLLSHHRLVTGPIGYSDSAGQPKKCHCKRLSLFNDSQYI